MTRLLAQTGETLRRRAARHGLSVDVVAAAVDMTVRDVGACFSGRQPIPLRLRVFMSLYGGTSIDARKAVMRAVREAANIPDRDWRSIPGFPLYEISDHGEVRRHGTFLKPVDQRSGHKKVSLYNGTKRGQTFGVHNLVARAFHGPAPAGKPNACHRNGRPADNRPANIYWGSTAENARDTVAHAGQRRADVERTWTCETRKHAASKKQNKFKMMKRLEKING